MIKAIINDILKQIKTSLPEKTPILLETDNQNSPSVSIWTADTDIEDNHEVIYTNWIIREPKEKNGELSRLVNKTLNNFQQIEKANYTVFGVAIPQGIKKLDYTLNNKDVEYLISVKVFYVI